MRKLLGPRTEALIGLQVLVVSGAMFLAATVQRDATTHAARQEQASQRLLTAMLDQETGARGFFVTRDRRFLEPWRKGTSDFSAALSESRSLAGDDPALQRSLDDQARRSEVWHAETTSEIDVVDTTGVRPSVVGALVRKGMMDGFRAENASFTRQLDRHRDRALWVATALVVGLAAGLSAAFLVVGLLSARRASRRSRDRMWSQNELRQLMQVSRSELESRTFLIRHLEEVVPGAGVAVLTPDGLPDRPGAILGRHTDRTPRTDLGIETGQPQPGSCLAMQIRRPYDRPSSHEPLLRCELCGDLEAEVACEPLLVAGEVLGSVLVTQRRPISALQRSRARETITQAAPILANQRNLALAEARANTDSLTGLPNRRAGDDVLKRMAAQAGRTVSPLAAVLLDLDRFKHINDAHGHDRGDAALVAVSRILASTLRASDFVARYGGEEFLLLLPNTNRAGASTLAETLRAAIGQVAVDGVGEITASFGVAVLPDDAATVDRLLRAADSALYRAKDGGRNRVVTTATFEPVGR